MKREAHSGNRDAALRRAVAAVRSVSMPPPIVPASPRQRAGAGGERIPAASALPVTDGPRGGHLPR